MIPSPMKRLFSVIGGLTILGFGIFAAIRAEKSSSVRKGDGWEERIIYFVLLDRFENGNPGNDKSYGNPECNDPADAHAFQGGDLAGLRQRIAAIEKLGANALWITPLYKGVPIKVGRNSGFPGYWAAFSDPYEFELDPRFGTAAEFDAVLAEARSRGICTILDMVVNHAGYKAPLVTQRPDWFHDPKTSASLVDPEIFGSLAGLPDFNHRNPEAATYLIDLHRRWVERFAFDGIRMDTVKHVEPWYFRDWIAGMLQTRPQLFIFGELLDESYEKFPRYLEVGFAGLFNFPLRRSLIETFAQGQSVDRAAARVQEMLAIFGQEPSRRLITLLDNHDVPRFMEEFPREMAPDVVRERYQLALTALLTLPGIPQLTYGNEVGMYGGADPDNRRRMPDWAFTPPYDEPDHLGFVTRPGAVWAHLHRLIEIRKKMPALTRGDYVEIWRQNDPRNPNVWAFVRAVAGDPVLVVIHSGDTYSGPLKLPLRGHFRDGQDLTAVSLEVDGKSDRKLESDRRYPVREGSIELELPARRGLILTTENPPS
jgi:glycosidase